MFGVYGIEVDPRHLSLVADYMTQCGDIRAFNRIHMGIAGSPLQRMSYETTIGFMKTVKRLCLRAKKAICVGNAIVNSRSVHESIRVDCCRQCVPTWRHWLL